jgi:2-dehydro-3-deoxyphosphooctonate aldolase (KDO 8-P synthase)
VSSSVEIQGIRIGAGRPLAFIGGPCVIESESDSLSHALRIHEICRRLEVPFVFKSSYDKANRMRADSFRGPGAEEGLRILAKVRREVGAPVLTDVHSPEEVARAAQSVDILQIPAFLCRQTDLVVAAARSNRVVNIKKGQFLSPWDMEHIAAKASAHAPGRVLLTERGTTFGYGHLVNDMRAIPVMQSFGCPVVFDAGHSVQMPGRLGGRSGGMREMIPVLARAAVAAGADALFVECHEDPDRAPSDGPNMLRLQDLEPLLEEVKSIRETLHALAGRRAPEKV